MVVELLLWAVMWHINPMSIGFQCILHIAAHIVRVPSVLRETNGAYQHVSTRALLKFALTPYLNRPFLYIPCAHELEGTAGA